MDTLTLLKTKGGLPLTKKITPAGDESYGGSKHYSVHSASVHDLDDVAQLLTKLSDKRDMAFIRGTLVNADLKDHVTRDGMNFRFRPQHTLALDVDSADTQHDALFDTEAACDEWIREYLPSQFHGVSFVYQLTSSAGFRPGLRARIWFWLDTPRSSGDLKPWAQTVAANPKSCLDASLFDAVKLHYTAAPIFEGVDDPFESGRVVLCKRDRDTVTDFDPTQYAVENLPSGAIRPKAGSLDPFLLVCRPVDKPDDVIKAYLDKATEVGAVDPDDYEDWIKVGRCLHHQFRGGDKGWELWDEWSSESGKYAGPAETAYRWRTFDNPERRGKRPQTFATILKLVKDHGVIFDEAALIVEKLKTAGSKAEIDELLKGFSGDLMDEEKIVVVLTPVLNRVMGVTTTQAAARKYLRKIHADYLKEAEIDIEDQLAEFTLLSMVDDPDHMMYFGQQFWRWENGVWGRVGEEEIVRNIREIYFDETNDDPMLGTLRSQAKNKAKNSAQLLKNALSMFSARLGRDIHKDPLNLLGLGEEDGSIINCQNGELHFDLDTNTISFGEHRAESYLTHQIAIDYNPEAKCPLWDQALRLSFSEAEDPKDLIRHLEEVLGYMIQTNRNASPIFVMFHGETGSNGKSFIADVLARMLGNAVSHKQLSDFERDGHATASLIGKLAVIDDDYAVGKAISDSWIKKLSESKVLTANPKNKDTFSFKSRALTIQLTNRWPDTKTFDGGVARRANIFPFDYQIKPSERIPNLAQRIVYEEGAGVLNRLIAGWQRVIARGMRFELPIDCRRAYVEWMGESAEVMSFIDDCLVYSEDANHAIPVKADLFKEYEYWANSLAKKPLGYRTFLAQLRDVAGAKGMTIEKMRAKGDTNSISVLTHVGFKDRPRQTFVRETFGEVVPFKKGGEV